MRCGSVKMLAVLQDKLPCEAVLSEDCPSAILPVGCWVRGLLGPSVLQFSCEGHLKNKKTRLRAQGQVWSLGAG